MKRATTLWLALALLLTAPLVLAQDSQSPRPYPPYPSDILGPQLIAWSEQYKPLPIPEALAGLPRRQPETVNPPISVQDRQQSSMQSSAGRTSAGMNKCSRSR
jgi:hypothetical protein